MLVGVSLLVPSGWKDNPAEGAGRIKLFVRTWRRIVARKEGRPQAPLKNRAPEGAPRNRLRDYDDEILPSFVAEFRARRRTGVLELDAAIGQGPVVAAAVTRADSGLVEAGTAVVEAVDRVDAVERGDTAVKRCRNVASGAGIVAGIEDVLDGNAVADVASSLTAALAARCCWSCRSSALPPSTGGPAGGSDHPSG